MASKKSKPASEDKGYLGSVPDPHPNEAYSLKSGPDSPSAAEAFTVANVAPDADDTPSPDKGDEK